MVLTQKMQEAFGNMNRYLSRDARGRGTILILLDAEDDLPCQLAPRLLLNARQAQGNADIACVLAKRMLENWIVAGCSTLAGKNGLPDPLPPPADPEGCSGSSWLDAQLRRVNRTRKYKKTVDAEAFVKLIDLGECRNRSPSFDKLCRELEARIPTPPPPHPPSA